MSSRWNNSHDYKILNVAIMNKWQRFYGNIDIWHFTVIYLFLSLVALLLHTLQVLRCLMYATCAITTKQANDINVHHIFHKNNAVSKHHYMCAPDYKAIGSPAIRYRSDTFTSHRYLIDIRMFFDIRDLFRVLILTDGFHNTGGCDLETELYV